MCHQKLYEEFEKREADLAVVTRNEIIVASPGIGDVLRSNRDFVTFKGFTVSVTTTEIYRKKTTFEGTLVERNDETVAISQKGRMIRIPREIIAEVRLPRSKYESTDTEMRKLR
jgi:ribosome maturation factor RimP